MSDTYPRRELCPCCEQAEVDVIGPGDTFAVCSLCHLALMDEHTTTLAEAYRLEEEHMRAAMADPDMSDDAICDAVIALRQGRGERPLW